MTTASRRATGPKPAPFDHIAAVNSTTFAAAAKANARMMHEMLAMQRKMLDFAARRIERDMETAKKFAECSDAPEMAILAQSFCAQAVTDYAAEATELMQITARMGAEAAQQAADARPNGKDADA